MAVNTELFDRIITKALSQRGGLKDDFDRHPVYRAPMYVVRMCEAVVDLIAKRGGFATLNVILRAEQCASGHTDYQRKCALYFAEIEAGVSALG